jgi:group I intron endonuclease
VYKIVFSGIYKIQSKCKPERIYIGSAVNIYNRWSVHRCDLRKGKHSSSAFQRHVNKYGLDDLEFSIIAVCDVNELNPIDKVVWIEQCFIWAYKHKGMNRPFFNASPTAGSQKGIKYPKEYGEAISARLRGKPGMRLGQHNTADHNAKIARAHIGLVNWEGVKKAAEKNRGRISPLRGRHHTPETIEKIKKNIKGKQQGEKNGFFGKKHSKESLLKAVESRRKTRERKKQVNQLLLPL